MAAHFAGELGDGVIVGGERASFAVRAEILPGIKTEDSRVAEAAHALAVVARAVGLAGVFDHDQVVALGDFEDWIQVCGAAIEMNRDDGLGAAGDGRRDQCGIEVGGGGIDVDEDRSGAGVTDGFGGGDEGVGGGDDFVAGADAGGQQREMQCAGAGVERDAVLDFTVAGEGLLEAGDFFSEDERSLWQTRSKASRISSRSSAYCAVRSK